MEAPIKFPSPSPSEGLVLAWVQEAQALDCTDHLQAAQGGRFTGVGLGRWRVQGSVYLGFEGLGLRV